MRTYDTFSHELRARAVRMVKERLTHHPSTRAAANSVAAELGCSLSAVSTWFARARNEGWLEWLRRNSSDEGQAEIVAMIVAQDERIERLEIMLARSTRLSTKLRAKGRLERLAKSRAQSRVKTLLAQLAKERQARRRAEAALSASTVSPVRRGSRRRRPLDIFQRLARRLQRTKDGKQAGPMAPEQIASVVNGAAKDECCWLWTGTVGPSVKMRAPRSLARSGQGFPTFALSARTGSASLRFCTNSRQGENYRSKRGFSAAGANPIA